MNNRTLNIISRELADLCQKTKRCARKINRNQTIKNARFAIARIALRGSLLLMRFGKWSMPPRNVFFEEPAMAGTAAQEIQAPPPLSGELRMRLDIPFFMGTQPESIIGGAAVPYLPATGREWQLTADKLHVGIKRSRAPRPVSASTCALLLGLCAAGLLSQDSGAATLSWTGGSSVTAGWSDSANWSPNAVPGNGDTLVFPSSPLLRQTSTNDLAGLTLNQVQFIGSGPTIIIGGNAFTLNNGMVVNYTFGGCYIYNNINLSGSDNVMNVAQSGYLGLGGTLSGTVGVTKMGLGILAYTAPGNNLYTGTTRVNAGGLLLNVNGFHACQGPLIIGDGTGAGAPIVQLAQPLEIDAIAPVTVNLNATLDLNGFNEVLPGLTLQGGIVQSGAGTLSMAGDITVLSSSVTPIIRGNLLFTGGRRTVNVAKASVFRDLDLEANVGDQGGGILFTNNAPSQVLVQMYGTNTFTGPLTLDNLTLGVEDPFALGATNSAATVGSHGTLWLYSTGITNHSLTLADGANLTGQDDCTWSGPITLNGTAIIDCYPSVAALKLLGTISGPGGFTKVDVGTIELFGNSGNTYSGDTYIQNGLCLIDKASGTAIPGGTLTIGDHLGSSAVVRDINVGANLGSRLAVAINEAGWLDLNGEFESVGPITLSGGTIGTDTGRLQINGDITTLWSTNNATIGGSILFAGGLRNINVARGYAPGGWDLIIPATISDTGSGFQFISGVVDPYYGPTEVFLQGSNSFTGPMTVNGGTMVIAENPWALGATTSGTFVTNAGTLFVGAVGITNETVTLAPGTSLTGQSGGANPVWAGPIVLNGNATIYGWGYLGLFDVLGAISGAGNLTVASDGEPVRFSGPAANTYGGTTTVAMSSWQNAGTTLLLDRTGLGNSIPGALIINSNCVVRDLLDWQLNSSTKPVTILDTGVLDLTNHNEWIGPLTMQGAQVTTGSGLLYLGGDITVNSSTVATSLIAGNASLWNGTRTITCAGHNFSPDFRIQANLGGNNSSGLIKTGVGEASLAGNNSFPGSVTVNAGSLWAETSSAFGNTNAPATVNSGGDLFLDGNVAIGLKPLSLVGTGSGQGALIAGFGNGSWAGNITLGSNVLVNVYTNAALELSGVISGPGTLTKTGWGNLLLDGGLPNNFAGATLVQQGLMTLNKNTGPAIPGPVTIGAGLDGSNGDVLKALQPNQLAQTSPLVISSSGLLDMTLSSITRAGSIAGSGSVQMGTSTLMFGYDNTSNTFSGPLSGSGDLTKVGTGIWTYTGTGSYGGNFGINSGQVFVDGSLASAAIFFYAGTTFGGSGSVGPVTSGNGLLSVGDNNPGILNSGSLTLASGDTFLGYIAGTNAGTGYSEMSFSGGTISLGSAHLQLNMSVVGATNTHYTLIHNPTAHVISGIFNGLAEGATVTANNGVHLTITYHGGPTGNDVVLTQTTAPLSPTLTAISHATNGVVTLSGLGAPTVMYHVQATTNLAPATWIDLGPATADSLGTLGFTDAQAGTLPQRFYRLVYP
jgi:autotransporter-associated beta strand protein